MPKKPFSPEEVAFQRERIMDSAAAVMAELGFHYLSMRKLAAELGMTASNIYNYFSSKESLLLNIRRRGYELLMQQTNRALMESTDASDSIQRVSAQMIDFACSRAGYYQLMFQPPVIKPGIASQEDSEAMMVLERLVEEWQLHVQKLLCDAIEGLGCAPETEQRRITLYFLTSIHGLIDSYQHSSMPLLLEGVDLIPQDMLHSHTEWLVNSLQYQPQLQVS